MDRETIAKFAEQAGWSGLYITWAEPTGKPDWTPFKESLTVPVTVEQIERFAALVAAAVRTRRFAKASALKRTERVQALATT